MILFFTLFCPDHLADITTLYLQLVLRGAPVVKTMGWADTNNKRKAYKRPRALLLVHVTDQSRAYNYGDWKTSTVRHQRDRQSLTAAGAKTLYRPALRRCRDDFAVPAVQGAFQLHNVLLTAKEAAVTLSPNHIRTTSGAPRRISRKKLAPRGEIFSNRSISESHF